MTFKIELLIIVVYVIAQCLIGYKTYRTISRGAAWLFPLATLALIAPLTEGWIPGLRLLALIAPLLHSMKVLVAREFPQVDLSLKEWIQYYFVAFSMDPRIFSRPAKPEKKMLVSGVLHLLLGAGILMTLAYMDIPISEVGASAFWGYSILALLGISLCLHFGILTLNTYGLNAQGVGDHKVFDKPFVSNSLAEFWGKRWNYAFSEMASTMVFKPLVRKMGARKASFVVFVFSGVLHDIALSLSVGGGYGLPTLYFVLHGVFLLMEKRVFKKAPGKLWVIMTVVLPFPLLFHRTFLEKVVWPLVEAI